MSTGPYVAEPAVWCRRCRVFKQSTDARIAKKSTLRWNCGQCTRWMYLWKTRMSFNLRREWVSSREDRKTLALRDKETCYEVEIRNTHETDTAGRSMHLYHYLKRRIRILRQYYLYIHIL